MLADLRPVSLVALASRSGGWQITGLADDCWSTALANSKVSSGDCLIGVNDRLAVVVVVGLRVESTRHCLALLATTTTAAPTVHAKSINALDEADGAITLLVAVGYWEGRH